MVKRALDLIGALVGLLVTAPILLVVALAIAIDSRGPLVYRQVRVGRGGRPFTLYKFRTMVVNAERMGAAVTCASDPRVTRVGRVLRSWRLDELPQLVNVIKGDMSLVGPRPEVPAAVARYSDRQRDVLSVRPGITGPTQLAWLDESELYPPGVDVLDYYVRNLLPRKLESDLHYVRTWSIRSDLIYLLKTGVVLARRAGLGRLPPRVQRIARFTADVTAIAVAVVGSFLIRFEGNVPRAEMSALVDGLPLALGAYALAFVAFRTSRGLWRYAGLEDLQRLVKACGIGALLSIVPASAAQYPRSIIVLTPILGVLLMAGLRLAARLGAQLAAEVQPLRSARRVLVVGAGKTGEAVAREILTAPELGYDLVGFVDDDVSLRGALIHGRPVLGTPAELEEIAGGRRIEEVIIALPVLVPSELRGLNERCARAGLEVRIVPSLDQLVSGDGRLRYLRKINVDELLHREHLAIDEARIRGLLRGRTVMVTGAGGSIGSELCRQTLRLGAASLVMVERSEGLGSRIERELQERFPLARVALVLADIKHSTRMNEVFAEWRPDIVFHAAAYKHVPILERHPAEAILNNVVGTRRLADLARAHEVDHFVLISTDKAAAPKNLMGATKRLCEMYTIALNHAEQLSGRPRTRFHAVRFGNVLGSSGSAVPLFQRQIERGQPITITHPEASRFFMTVAEAVSLVLESASMNVRGDIAVLDMGQPVRIKDLAEDLIMALGLPPSEVEQEYVGLRPGEKLHEVLWEEEIEEVLPSPHPRIFAIRQRGRPVAELEELLNELESLALGDRIEEALAKIHELVPTYVPDGGLASVDAPEGGGS